MQATLQAGRVTYMPRHKQATSQAGHIAVMSTCEGEGVNLQFLPQLRVPNSNN